MKGTVKTNHLPPILHLGTERGFFFKSQLKNLAHAASSGYNALLEACRHTQLIIDQSYPSIPHMDTKYNLQTIPTHQYSESILPKEWKHVRPITCYGDGNCLYRCVEHCMFKLLAGVKLMMYMHQQVCITTHLWRRLHVY